MSLLDIRKLFIQRSGRYDLVIDTTDYVDNGADFFIQSGQKWLERQAEFAAEKGKVFRKLALNKFALTFRDMRTIESVYIACNGTRRKLDHISYDKLVEKFPATFTTVTIGEPAYWTPMCIRNVNMDSDSDTGGIVDYMDVIENSDNYNAVVIMPPANQDIHVEISGKFRSKKLTLDADTNYWTDNEPFILMLCALRALEVSYRNTQGVNDWTASIMSELFGLEKDYVENDTNFIPILEG